MAKLVLCSQARTHVFSGVKESNGPSTDAPDGEEKKTNSRKEQRVAAFAEKEAKAEETKRQRVEKIDERHRERIAAAAKI